MLEAIVIKIRRSLEKIPGLFLGDLKVDSNNDNLKLKLLKG
jgi:hypothetical protein